MTDTIPMRSSDFGDRMQPIPTRLPAGLTESELMTGYQRCATGCSAAPFVSVNGEAICERCARLMEVQS